MTLQGLSPAGWHKTPQTAVDSYNGAYAQCALCLSPCSEVGVGLSLGGCPCVGGSFWPDFLYLLPDSF